MPAGALASIGLGLYRQRNNPLEICEGYIASGGTFVDCAPNYLSGEAHSVLRACLSNLGPGNKCSYNFGTKVGFLKSREVAQQLVTNGILPSDHKLNDYWLSPQLIRYQIDETLRELGISNIPLLFIHNPERLLSRGKIEATDILERCVECLEGECSSGTVSKWGIATWSGFGGSHAGGAFSVVEIESIAQRIAGSDHHFAAVQIPLGLGHNKLLYDYILLRRGAVMEARELDKDIYASSPLNGGELLGAISNEFLTLFPGTPTKTQACLQFIASVPGIRSVIVGARTIAQLREALGVAALPALSEASLRYILGLLNS